MIELLEVILVEQSQAAKFSYINEAELSSIAQRDRQMLMPCPDIVWLLQSQLASHAQMHGDGLIATEMNQQVLSPPAKTLDCLAPDPFRK